MRATTKAASLIVLGALALSNASRADSHLPTPALVKQALEVNKRQWVAFRNFNGKQFVYYSNLLTWHCALTSIRYRYNDSEEWQTRKLPKCYEDAPYIVNPETDKLYDSFAPDTIKTVSIEITLSDETTLPIHRFSPCDVPAGVTCGKPAD